MENASKALLMAAAVLIAIVIISLSLWLFQRSSDMVRSNDFSQAEIDNFNSKIEAYCGENVNGSQVNALINLVRSIDLTAQSSEGDTMWLNLVWKDAEGNERGSIIVNTSDNYTMTETPSKLRVTTGKYYKVTPTYNKSVLITSVEIKEK